MPPEEWEKHVLSRYYNGQRGQECARNMRRMSLDTEITLSGLVSVPAFSPATIEPASSESGASEPEARDNMHQWLNKTLNYPRKDLHIFQRIKL